MRTSSQLYTEYEKARLIEQKTERDNKGVNLLGTYKPEKEKFFVRVFKTVEQNLVEKKEMICVETNMYFVLERYYGRNASLKEFLEGLTMWVSKPRYEYATSLNRKGSNTMSCWERDRFRERSILFKELVIEIGEHARFDLETNGTDFHKIVEQILSNQLDATEQEAKDFERHLYLYEKVSNLGRFGKSKSGNYYSYGYEKDDTTKIQYSADEYNSMLKKVEVEMKELVEKYPYLKKPYFSYIEKKEEEDFDENEGGWE